MCDPMAFRLALDSIPFLFTVATVTFIALGTWLGCDV